jgi:hypothetical protein
MTASDLDIFQQVYVQTFTVDAVGMVNGTEATLQAALITAVNSVMTTELKAYGWQVTWGPRVWKDDPSEATTGPDNAWFAAFAPNVKYPDGVTIDTCVVSIAGSSKNSSYDWKIEDFGVNEVVDFDRWMRTWTPTSIPKPQGIQNPAPGTPFPAYGTSIGVYQLMNNPAPDGTPGAGTRIAQYLQTLPSNCRIIFTGHSLGGALSPTLAMGLEASGLLSQIQKPLNNILTLPCAGASPGEKHFRSAYSRLFPQITPGSYKCWDADFFNTFDIVPQAWCNSSSVSSQRNLHNILTIYGKLPSSLRTEIEFLIKKEIAHADKSGVIYDPIQGNAFKGNPPTNIPSNLTEFMQEAITQHVYAYISQVGLLPTVARLYRNIAKLDGVKKQTLVQVAKGYPVLRLADEHKLQDGSKVIYPYDDLFKG